MAATGKTQSKSGFLLEFLQENPGATEAEAKEAWQEAGNEGTVSSSSFYNAKSALAKNGSAAPASKSKAKAKGPAKGLKAVRSFTPSGGSNGGFAPRASSPGHFAPEIDAVEGEIDELIFRLKGLGGVPDVEEALRRARRLLTLKHGE